MNALPVNFKKQNHAPEAIRQAAEYAVSVADGFELWMRGNGPAHLREKARPFAGLSVLEVGPGASLGSAAVLACAGARVAVADRFLAPWDPDFHAPLFRRMSDTLAPRGDGFVAPIERLLSAGDFDEGVMTCHQRASEDLEAIGAQFDVVLSNAVLEHVEDIHATARNLAAVTLPGGYGFHQVDFRDHRSFARPLEYLTVSSAEFDPIRRKGFCEAGCQWRASTVAAAFEMAGFDCDISPNLFADEKYLADLRPRLHAEFAHFTDEELRTISALFVVRRR